jgi:GDPmannose 4,6-dehydratase
MKRALITGVGGQDGSYLAELLLAKGYSVTGITLPKANRNNIATIEDRIELIEGDITDEKFVRETVSIVKPDEIYNLASIATVAKPWEDVPALSRVVALSPVYFLESIRTVDPKIRFFQASSSEMFGAATESPQNERTPIAPRNPYGIAKAYAHAMVGGYRANQNLFAVSGIFYTHESPRRPPEFVTRKITSTLTKIKHGHESVLELGNLDARRDWGFAGDYTDAMWRTLQAQTPDDYVIATGVTHTVREFVLAAARALDMTITFEGSGIDEVGKDEKGSVIVKVNPTFYRPAEPVVLCGDPSKIATDLGWKPETSFEQLVSMMVKADMELT